MMLVIYCKWTLHNPEPLSHKNKDLCLINIVLSTWVIKVLFSFELSTDYKQILNNSFGREAAISLR